MISHVAASALSVWRNPVMLKEIRTRMRGSRAFTVVCIHLLLLAAAVGLVYLMFGSTLTISSNLEQRRVFGKVIFGLLIWLELITVCFTAPALTSGAIASERERQTFDLLRVTLLPPSRLVAGKFLSALIFVYLLLFSAIPLHSLSFIIGGVLAEEIWIAITILAVTTVAICSVGLFFSSIFGRVLFATVLSYAFAIFLVFGIPLAFMFFAILGVSAFGSSSLLENLSLSSQVLLVFFGWLVVSLNPGATIIATEAAILDQQGIWLAHLDLGANAAVVTMPSPWIAYVVFYLLISVILLLFAVQRVKRVEV